MVRHAASMNLICYTLDRAGIVCTDYQRMVQHLEALLPHQRWWALMLAVEHGQEGYRFFMPWRPWPLAGMARRRARRHLADAGMPEGEAARLVARILALRRGEAPPAAWFPFQNDAQ